MASLAPSADVETSGLLQNLTLDSQTKTLDVPEFPKEVQSCERPMTPLLPNPMDPVLCYYPYGYPSYYHGSYDGTGNEWNDYSRYLSANGVDVASGVYGNSGSIMYHHGYGPYGAYSLAAPPASTIGKDDQLYGPIQYHYPPSFKPLTSRSRPFTPNKAASQKWDHSVSTNADQKPMPAENAKGNSNGNANVGNTRRTNGSTPYKPKHQTYRRGTFHGGPRSPNLWLDTSVLSNGQCRSSEMTRSFSKAGDLPSPWNQNSYIVHSGLTSGVVSSGGFTNGMYQKKLHGYYGDGFSYGLPFSCYDYSVETKGYGRSAMDGKYKPRDQCVDYYHCYRGNIDCLNELSKGPRTKGSKNHNSVVPVTLTVKTQNMPSNYSYSDNDKMTLVPDEELYNRADFPENYTDAKFYIIKSYSEDDVHKSIKYNVWASTSSGNKKLDAAYKEAQQTCGGCHVFLFFSVNASGQFVGLAEMVGPVDFDKNMEHWQQDKWTGCFPVKWHIVKDVPNSLLKHLILENNENKPVTNSRDTQEVKLDQGLKMIKIFKDHSSETSILDDFGFYENREQIIQQKKAKQQLIKEKILEGQRGQVGQLGNQDHKLADDDLQKSLETLPDMIKEPALTAKSSEKDQQSENALAANAGDGDESKGG